MAERDVGKPGMQGRVELDDACRRGVRSGTERGRGAAGRIPFVAALATPLDRKTKCSKLQVVACFGKAESAGSAQSGFAAGTTVASRLNRDYQLDIPTELLLWVALQSRPRPFGAVIAG